MRKNSRARSWVSKKIARLVKEGANHSQAVATALSMARHHGLINPGDETELSEELNEAQEVARGFHGRDNREIVEVDSSETYRSDLAMLGYLCELEVLVGDEVIPLEFSYEQDPVFVNCTSDRKQLILVGGDQALPDEVLEQSGDGYDKDKVRVGYVYSISYFADKHHLTGPKQQKKGTEYQHGFGESSFPLKNPKYSGIWKLEEKIEAGKLPLLIYDRLNERIELVGGGYFVKDEGIFD